MEKIILGLSGGVDSSVAAHLLKTAGWDVTGVFLVTGCDDGKDAESVARALGIGGKEDHLVLNSVSNVAMAYRHLDGYGQIKCYLDNDEAGRRTLGALLARYGGRVSNCSGIYDGCKDLNEHLQRVLAERQAQSENEKKNKSIRL